VGLIEKERPQLTTKLKHVDVHHLWIRQTARQGAVVVQWVSTHDMPADGLTKRLSKERQAAFVRALGMVDTARQDYET
jgi:hypothetical protein